MIISYLFVFPQAKAEAAVLESSKSRRRNFHRLEAKPRLETQFEDEMEALENLDFEDQHSKAKRSPLRKSDKKESNNKRRQSGLQGRPQVKAEKGQNRSVVPEEEEEEEDDDHWHHLTLGPEQVKADDDDNDFFFRDKDDEEWQNAKILQGAMTGDNLLGMLEKPKAKFGQDNSNNDSQVFGGEATLDLFIDRSNPHGTIGEKHPALQQVMQSLSKKKEERGSSQRVEWSGAGSSSLSFQKSLFVVRRQSNFIFSSLSA